MFRRGRVPELLYTRTRDGWKLALHHYPARPRRQSPIMLVHGLGANRYDLDAPDRQISLARFLHARGHDVWVAELRGAGCSKPVAWPPKLTKPTFDFDDYVHRDIPALVRKVLDHSGAERLHWVGHSMGGMLAYAALEHYSQRLFQSVVTIASPGFTAMRHPSVDLMYRFRFFLQFVRYVPYRSATKFGWLFPRLALLTAGPLVSNTEHMTRKHIRMLARRATDDIPSALLEQFAGWYNDLQGFSRTDGLLDYYEHLGRIQAPVLVIAGQGDSLTPVPDLNAVFRAIGSRDKKFLVFGREQGHSLDYGHIDLILGTHAPAEVYPEVSTWIEAHEP